MPIVPAKWQKSYSSKKAAAKKADELEKLKADASKSSNGSTDIQKSCSAAQVDMVTCPGYSVQSNYEASLNSACTWSLPSRYIRYVPPKNAVREWWQPMASGEQAGTDAAADEEEWVFECICGMCCISLLQ